MTRPHLSTTRQGSGRESRPPSTAIGEQGAEALGGAQRHRVVSAEEFRCGEIVHQDLLSVAFDDSRVGGASAIAVQEFVGGGAVRVCRPVARDFSMMEWARAMTLESSKPGPWSETVNSR